MSDKKFTFIELHLDGETQFGPKALNDALPFGEALEAEESGEDEETDDEATASADDSSSTALGVIVGLVALVGVAVAVKKFRGGDDDGSLEADEEPEIIVS